jgi:biotin carboxyl carrier protein
LFLKPAGAEGTVPSLQVYLAFPSAALPASGSMGIISARYIEAPLNTAVKLAIQVIIRTNGYRNNAVIFLNRLKSYWNSAIYFCWIYNSEFDRLFLAMFKASVNEKNFVIRQEDGQVLINGEPLSWDLSQIREGYFHILHNNQSYRAEVVKIDKDAKTFTWKINGRIYTVKLQDRFDLLLEKMGMKNVSSGKVNSIKAPMPGLIIDLKVKDGDSVKQGDPLLILEAMKMENILKSPGDGVVKSVKVKKGDSVEKNHVLIEF